MTPSGTVRPERFWGWFFITLGASVLFGALVAWVVLPRQVLPW